MTCVALDSLPIASPLRALARRWLPFTSLGAWAACAAGEQNDTMYEFYMEYLVPFAEVLTEIERVGIKVDVEHRLPAAERAAIADRDASERHFLCVARSHGRACVTWKPAPRTRIARSSPWPSLRV